MGLPGGVAVPFTSLVARGQGSLLRSGRHGMLCYGYLINVIFNPSQSIRGRNAVVVVMMPYRLGACCIAQQ